MANDYEVHANYKFEKHIFITQHFEAIHVVNFFKKLLADYGGCLSTSEQWYGQIKYHRFMKARPFSIYQKTLLDRAPIRERS